MTAPLLVLDGVTGGYSGRLVLHGLSMAVPEGGFVAIIGPNGHGKTTLLRAISGLLPLESGAIEVAGQRLDRRRPDEIVAAGVVHVPQGDLLFPEMTVLENLQMGAYLPPAGAKMAESLDMVFALLPKLAERRRQVASTLSGGERRMVGIGRGLMAGGRVLMLDEPSLGLAPIVIDQIYEVIARLRAAGRTVLLVEENAARVVDSADHIYLLDNGRFVWDGVGAELMSRPEIVDTYLGG
jgi:branched-chain amino acid transport system ATP-binding protein